MSDSFQFALRFHDAGSREDLGPVPCSIAIPQTAWLYAANSNRIDFSAMGVDVWIYLLLKVQGEATVGVSVMREDGSAILTREQTLKPAAAPRSVMLRTAPVIGSGVLLIRNYGTEGKFGRADILDLEILPCTAPKAKLAAAVQPIFDPIWYVTQYPDVDWSQMDPFTHYLNIGAANGADATALFNSKWYVAKHPDALGHDMSPVEHYLSIGAASDYDPSPAFFTRWYRDLVPELRDSTMSPLEHYLTVGREQELLPNPLADGFLLDDLLEQHDVESALRWYAHLESVPGGEPAKAVILPLKEVYRHIAGHGRILYSQPYVSHSERPLEEGPLRYIAELNDVVIQGGGDLIVTPEGVALHDELLHTDRHFPTDTKTALIARLKDGRILLRAPDRFTPRLDSGIHLMNEADANYFHWVAEVLPRLFLMQESGVLQSLPQAMPLLLTDGLDPRLPEMLRYVLPEGRPIANLKRGHLYKIDQVVYPGPVARVLNNCFREPSPANTYLPVDVLTRMAAVIKQQVPPGNPGRRRRVYLNRSGEIRVLINQSALQDELVERGFEILDPSNLSARAQIQLFSQCDQIIAPTGAALTNILWCEPKTRITVLYPDHVAINPGIWSALAQAAGCVIEHIFCPRSHDIVGKFGASDNFTFPMEWLSRLL